MPNCKYNCPRDGDWKTQGVRQGVGERDAFYLKIFLITLGLCLKKKIVYVLRQRRTGVLIWVEYVYLYTYAHILLPPTGRAKNTHVFDIKISLFFNIRESKKNTKLLCSNNAWIKNILKSKYFNGYKRITSQMAHKRLPSLYSCILRLFLWKFANSPFKVSNLA